MWILDGPASLLSEDRRRSRRRCVLFEIPVDGMGSSQERKDTSTSG